MLAIQLVRDDDFVLATDSAWLEVDSVSLFIRRKHGCLKVDAYETGNECGNSLASIRLPIEPKALFKPDYYAPMPDEAIEVIQ